MPAKGTGNGRTRVPLTLPRLKQLLSYEPVTGQLRWCVARGRNKHGQALPGDVVGANARKDRYIFVNIDGFVYYAHRLAWALAHDAWPVPHQIDHINMNRSDNRLRNLRAATNGQNMCNSGARSNNGTGFKGAYPTPNGTFQSKIGVNGETIFLGTFPTIDAARSAYNEAARRLHGKFFKPA